VCYKKRHEQQMWGRMVSCAAVANRCSLIVHRARRPIDNRPQLAKLSHKASATLKCFSTAHQLDHDVADFKEVLQAGRLAEILIGMQTGRLRPIRR
jgi:hypothetical protein